MNLSSPRSRFARRLVISLFVSALAFAAESPDAAKKAEGGRKGKAAAKAAATGAATPKGAGAADAPTFPSRPTAVGPVVGENKATPVSRFKVPVGFKVELIYSVPGATQGSWVNLCVDPKGRMIASDQYGGLFRFPIPAPGEPLDPAKVEKVPAEIRAVNGMLWAFGALYVGVNDYENKIPSGLYRLTDSDGDDQLDKVGLLRALEARGHTGVNCCL